VNRTWNILIVEDEPLLLELLQDTLSNEYRIGGVAIAEEARLALQSSQVDLVVLDRVLPDGNGDEIAALAETLGVSIIEMSGYPQDWDQSARHPYLMKPFRVDELLSKVRSALRRRLVSSP
jgi:DNA-binding response OmpR family regulator